MSKEGETLVFYDGDCGFCVRSVSWVRHLDADERLGYLSLEEGRERGFEFEEGTMAVVRGGETFLRSEAVRVLLWECGGLGRVGSVILAVIPLFLREWGYRLVARNRYRLMGKVEGVKPDT
ncbi:MAG: thiol-disulfide oxidoreductase DCC family protein [Verrucomicrobiaceae bacterium]